MKRRRVLPEPLTAAVKRADTILPSIGLSRRIERVQDAVESMERRYDKLLSSRERTLRQLRAENRRLRQHLRELSVEKAILQDVARRLPRSAQRKQIVDYVVERYGLDKRDARRLLGQQNLLARKPYARSGNEWKLSLQDRAQLWVAQGYEQVNVVVQKQGWIVGRRLAYRVYIDEPRKHLQKQARKIVAQPAGWLQRLRLKGGATARARPKPA